MTPGHDTAEMDMSRKQYRPLFMDHFDKKGDGAGPSRNHEGQQGNGNQNQQLRVVDYNQDEHSPSQSHPDDVTYSSMFNFYYFALYPFVILGYFSIFLNHYSDPVLSLPFSLNTSFFKLLSLHLVCFRWDYFY